MVEIIYSELNYLFARCKKIEYKIKFLKPKNTYWTMVTKRRDLPFTAGHGVWIPTTSSLVKAGLPTATEIQSFTGNIRENLNLRMSNGKL